MICNVFLIVLATYSNKDLPKEFGDVCYQNAIKYMNISSQQAWFNFSDTCGMQFYGDFKEHFFSYPGIFKYMKEGEVYKFELQKVRSKYHILNSQISHSSSCAYEKIYEAEIVSLSMAESKYYCFLAFTEYNMLINCIVNYQDMSLLAFVAIVLDENLGVVDKKVWRII